MLSRMSISTCGRLFRISSVHLLSVASPSSSNHSNHYVYHNSLRHFSSSISSDKNPSAAKGNSAHSGKHQKKNLIYLRPLEKFEVIFVGTGGVTRSSKFRGNSCIALKLDGKN